MLFCGSTALSDGHLLQNFGGQTSFLAAHLALPHNEALSLDTLSTVLHANQIPRRSSECKTLTRSGHGFYCFSLTTALAEP